MPKYSPVNGSALKNFPDGIWGVYFGPNTVDYDSFITGLLLEYVQTTDIDGTILFNEISDGKRYIEENLIYEVECQKDSFLIRKSKFSTINMEKSHIFYDAFEKY